MKLPLFELNGVSHRFEGGSTALDCITSNFHTEQSVALLGCNGAGKSTLLHILGGLITPCEGSIRWMGKELTSRALLKDPVFRSSFRRSVGTVFQDPDSQWLCETVREELLYGPRQIWSFDQAQTRVSQVLEIMGINHLASQPPYTLSGGQKRRVALASIISMDPEVLLLDEPTSSLDAATIDFLVDWLQEFRLRPGKTLILATHDLALVKELCDKCMVITPCHKLAMMGDSDDILSNPGLLRQMNLLSRRHTNVWTNSF